LTVGHCRWRSIKELARRWAPQIAAQFSKDASHLALADIHDSIRELQFYRQCLFVPAAQAAASGEQP
jgi:oligoribonuclease